MDADPVRDVGALAALLRANFTLDEPWEPVSMVLAVLASLDDLLSRTPESGHHTSRRNTRLDRLDGMISLARRMREDARELAAQRAARRADEAARSSG